MDQRIGNTPTVKVLLLHGGSGFTHEDFEAFDSFFRQRELSTTTTSSDLSTAISQKIQTFEICHVSWKRSRRCARPWD